MENIELLKKLSNEFYYGDLGALYFLQENQDVLLKSDVQRDLLSMVISMNILSIEDNYGGVELQDLYFKYRDELLKSMNLYFSEYGYLELREVLK